MWSVTKLALRAAVWRTTPEPRLGGLPALLLALVVLAAVRVAFELLAAGPGWAFNPYGLNAVVAWLALEVAVAALFVQPGARMAALTAMFMLSVVAEIVLHAAEIAAPLLPPVDLARFGVTWSGPVAPFAILGVVSIWWIGAVIAVLRSLGAQAWFAVFGRAVGIWLALLAVSALVPHAPVFVARDFDIRTANLWESARVRLMAAADNTGTAKSAPAPQEHAQRALLQAQIAKLAPPVKGKTNLYAVGIAGWSGQDVFLKELDGGLAALGEILPIGGHTLRLVNSSETRETLPLADPRNFVAAIHAAAGLMNKNDDVLVLLMTSHGMQSGFGLRLPNEMVIELTPAILAAALEQEGIKNRLVIVSACFAGIFVPPLANDDTIVLTAADAKNTSFGCGAERDWTYFGDALFRQSLRHGRDLQQAFDNARSLIHGWELMDRATPSNPQGHFGPALVARLAPFFAAPSGTDP